MPITATLSDGARDVAATQRGDPHVTLGSWRVSATSTDHRREIAATASSRVDERQRRAARRVPLLVVVQLDQLDGKRGP